MFFLRIIKITRKTTKNKNKKLIFTLKLKTLNNRINYVKLIYFLK